MATQTKVIGPISAYAIAVQEGYTGSKAEWAEAIGNAQANAAAAEAAADRVQNLTESLPDDFTDTIANFAPTYSTSSTYAVGDYVIHYGSLYRCITKITTAEAWTPAHWTQVSVGEDLAKTVWHETQNLTSAQRSAARNNIQAADQMTVDYHSTQISDLETGKQDKLTFDSTPTVGSSNPVTSAGIKTVTDALAGDVDDLKSAYFNWLQREGLISQNPTANLGSIKRQKKVKAIYSDVDIERLKYCCTSVRDRAIVAFLLSTGCRISEVTGLNRNDIDLVNLECTVLGKGNKERTVYMDPVTAMLLKEYLAERKDFSSALFAGKGTDRMSPHGVRKMLTTLSEKARVEHVYPHKFRRTLATNLIRHGMPIQEVASILGHDKLDTTMQYVVLDKSDVKNSYRKYA